MCYRRERLASRRALYTRSADGWRLPKETPEHLSMPALISWHLTGKCKSSILIHHSHTLTCIQGELLWSLLFPYNFSYFFASQHHPTMCPTECGVFQAFYGRSFGFVSLMGRQKGIEWACVAGGANPVFGGGVLSRSFSNFYLPDDLFRIFVFLGQSFRYYDQLKNKWTKKLFQMRKTKMQIKKKVSCNNHPLSNERQSELGILSEALVCFTQLLITIFLSLYNGSFIQIVKEYI